MAEMGAIPPSTETTLERKKGRAIASHTRATITTPQKTLDKRMTVSKSILESLTTNRHVYPTSNLHGRFGSVAASQQFITPVAGFGHNRTSCFSDLDRLHQKQTFAACNQLD